MGTNNATTDYTIISKPAYVQFECPHCHEEVEIPFNKVNYKTDYWGDGAWCNCSNCSKEVNLVTMSMIRRNIV